MNSELFKPSLIKAMSQERKQASHWRRIGKNLKWQSRGNNYTHALLLFFSNITFCLAAGMISEIKERRNLYALPAPRMNGAREKFGPYFKRYFTL